MRKENSRCSFSKPSHHSRHRITLALQLLASMHQAATDFLVMHGYSRELVCQAVNIELGEALRGAKGGVRH